MANMKKSSGEAYSMAVRKALGGAVEEPGGKDPKVSATLPGHADSAPADHVAVRAHTRSRKKKKHPGFKAVAGQIAAKENVSKAEASAMLAASSRGASSAAKKKNPRLRKVR